MNNSNQQPKKKKGKGLTIVVVIAAIILLFATIGSSEDTAPISNTTDTSVNDEKVTESATATTTMPSTTTSISESAIFDNEYIVPCDNDSGAIFSFTLDEFTQMYNQNILEFLLWDSFGNVSEDIVNAYSLDANAWKYVDSEKETNSGFEFDAYFNLSVANSKVVVTAMCEHGTKRVKTLVFSIDESKINDKNYVTFLQRITGVTAATLNGISDGEDILATGINGLSLTAIRSGGEGKSVYYNNIIASTTIYSVDEYAMAFFASSNEFIEALGDRVVPYNPD